MTMKIISFANHFCKFLPQTSTLSRFVSTFDRKVCSISFNRTYVTFDTFSIRKHHFSTVSKFRIFRFLLIFPSV